MSRAHFATPAALIAMAFAFTALLAPKAAFAKRSAPSPVAPIDVGDVRLVVSHFAFQNACKQTGGCVEIVERATGKLKRAVKVYTTVVDPALESDVQDVFI